MPFTTTPAGLALVEREPDSLVGKTQTVRKVALTGAERAAATGLVSGEAAFRHVQDRATAFATGDAAVRRRSLSRASAVQEQQVADLAALLASAISRRDLELAKTLDRALTSATHRYRALMEQLRIESGVSRRVTMLAQGPVAITAEAGP